MSHLLFKFVPEKFNKFLDEGKKSGAEVTSYIKDSFKDKSSKKKD